MAEPKKSNQERLREITEGIEQDIKELFESEKYRKYLSTMSRFHRYSVNNVTLIHMQMPNATHVAGYNKWRDQFERHVKKGNMALRSLHPPPSRRKSRNRSSTRFLLAHFFETSKLAARQA